VQARYTLKPKVHYFGLSWRDFLDSKSYNNNLRGMSRCEFIAGFRLLWTCCTTCGFAIGLKSICCGFVRRHVVQHDVE